MERSATLSAAVLSMCMLSLGEIVAFRSEKYGALIQNVVPVPGRERQQSNAGSRRLEMHVENVHHENRPDLSPCFVFATTMMTQLVCVSPRFVRRCLWLRLGTAGCSPSSDSAPPTAFVFRCGRKPDPSCIARRLRGSGIRVDFANTAALDPEAAGAMDALKRGIETVCEELVLEAGDLAIRLIGAVVSVRPSDFGDLPRLDAMLLIGWRRERRLTGQQQPGVDVTWRCVRRWPGRRRERGVGAPAAMPAPLMRVVGPGSG